MPRIERGPFLLLYAVNQQLDALLTKAMAETPLRPGEFAVYSTLRLLQPTTPSDLAHTLGLRPTTLSSHLQKMAERGHLVRQAHPHDGRSILLSLTPEGLTATVACFATFSRAIGAFQEALTVDEQALLDHLEATSAALEVAGSQLAGPRADSGAADQQSPGPP